MLQRQTFRLPGVDGASLFVRAWLPSPQRPIKGLVQVVHGVAEHSGRYEGVAARLAERGYAVYAQDLRGHGRTASGERALGLFAERDGWSLSLTDLERVTAHLEGRYPGRPLALIGHSMGSFLAQHHAMLHGERLAALVLSGSDMRPAALFRLGAVLAGIVSTVRGPTHRSRWVNFLFIGNFKYHVRGRRTDFDWLTRNGQSVEEYRRDPLCGWDATATLWRDVCQGLIYVNASKHRRAMPARLPMLLLAGGADALNGGGRRVRRLADAYRAAGVERVDASVYPGARHEVFNETNRAAVYRELVDWLDARMADRTPVRSVASGRGERASNDDAGH